MHRKTVDGIIMCIEDLDMHSQLDNMLFTNDAKYSTSTEHGFSMSLISIRLPRANTVSVASPKPTTVPIQSWVQLIQHFQCYARCRRHVVTVYAIFLHYPHVTVDRYARLGWARR